MLESPAKWVGGVWGQEVGVRLSHAQISHPGETRERGRDRALGMGLPTLEVLGSLWASSPYSL